MMTPDNAGPSVTIAGICAKRRSRWLTAGHAALLIALSCFCVLADAQDVDTPAEQPPAETAEPEVSAQTETAETAADPVNDSWRVKWRRWMDATRGLTTWDLFDGRLTLRAGVKLQVDGTVAQPSDLMEQSFGAMDNSLRARRLRVFATGTIDRHLRYAVSYDLGTDRGFKDIYIEGVDKGLIVWGYDVGQFRLGSFKEPFSMERQSSSNNFGMLEWALPVSTFAPGRNIGYMLHDTAKHGRFSWAAGFFSFGSREEDNASSSALSVTGRITGLPVYRDNGAALIHLGVAFSTREPRSGELQYRSRPEARFVPFLVDTGNLEASGNTLLGLELAGVRGPVWFQSEFIAAEIQTPSQGDPTLWGAYGQAGFFLTGETRPYKQSDGTFGRLIPRSSYTRGMPFKRKNGGALELVGRYSYLDLNDGDIRGGRLKNWSFGLNWYLSATSKVMLSYISSKTETQGSANIYLMRYQWNPW